MKNSLKNIILDELSDKKFSGSLIVRYTDGQIIDISKTQKEQDDQINRIRNEITFWQMRFRVLHDWKISYDDTNCYECQEHHNRETKTAIIYKCNNYPKTYILHEVLHIAIVAAEEDRDKNEFLVQDLSEIISNKVTFIPT